METFDFPYHTQRTEYPESGTRVQLGNGYMFTSPPNGPDLRRFTLGFPTMFYYLNDEPTSTNYIKNNTNVGAAVPSTFPNNWVTSVSGTNPPTGVVVGMGKEDGLPYIDIRIQASSSAQIPGFNIYPMTFNDVTAASGEVWTGSTYAKIISDAQGTVTSVTSRLYVQELNSSATSSAQTAVFLLSGVRQTPLIQTRQSHTRTLSSLTGTTSFVRNYYLFNWPNGTAVDFVVRIAGAQLEKSAAASSVIFTNGTFKTRTVGSINIDMNNQINMGNLEAFYNRHKLHKSFIYPHPVYGNVECKFYSPFKIPEGIVGGYGALKDFEIEMIEILQ